MANKEKEKKGGFKEYFKGVKIEMKKVVWPTKKEVVSSSTVIDALFVARFTLTSRLLGNFFKVLSTVEEQTAHVIPSTKKVYVFINITLIQHIL